MIGLIASVNPLVGPNSMKEVKVEVHGRHNLKVPVIEFTQICIYIYLVVYVVIGI